MASCKTEVLVPAITPFAADLSVDTARLTVARAIADWLGGTSVCLAPLPRMPIRPPMASAFASDFDATRWTTLDAALDQMIRAEVAS